MPLKVVPPVEVDAFPSKYAIGPVCVMSGFMTKKTRSLRRWKQRWWKLMDNGYLFYFKEDSDAKILGQVDIARTCYDVRLGSEKCHVHFPRATPSCCCISFAVLKRTYFAYTPTAAEAIKWVQCIAEMSRVINRKVVAGVEHRIAPDPTRPFRPPSCPPNFNVRMARMKTDDMSRSLEAAARATYVENSSSVVSSSVPDYLNRIVDDSVSLGDNQSLDSRLWLDGSPPQIHTSEIHPQDISLSVAEASWVNTSTTETEASLTSDVPADASESPSVVKRGHSPVQPPREHYFSLPTTVLMDFDSLEQHEVIIISPEGPQSGEGLLAPVADIETPSEGTQPLENSKNLSKSATTITQSRPVPKPRKGKEKKLATENLTLEATLSPLSPSPPPIRPRNNSEPPTIRPRINKGPPRKEATLSVVRQKKKNRSSKKRSPPSTPPPPPSSPPHSAPPPPPTRDDLKALPSLTLSSPPPRPRKDSGPPTFVPIPPDTLH